MKICRKCTYSVIVKLNAKMVQRFSKDTVPEKYLRCTRLGNKTCSYIKKKCEIHKK